MIRKVIVLGGGSAGFMAAVSLKHRLPQLQVEVIRSPEIGIIGVGEGSTTSLTRFLHKYLNVNQQKFFEVAKPTWKLGLRFIWGKRPYFHYGFGPQMDARPGASIPKPIGYYCENDIEYSDPFSALMTHDKVFEKRDGQMVMHDAFAYHVENEHFANYFELLSRAFGITITQATVQEVLQDEAGVAGLVLQSGETVKADLYIDASGFRSELLGKTLGEKYISFADTLFCDRAVVGGWNRGPHEQLIKPYTTCETMESGWCWQIEHENRINRGYVYSGAFISDADAEAEFRRQNPKLTDTRIVKFTSGRYERAWVKNVIAVGNASGFVEPLEATALANIASQCQTFSDALYNCDLVPRPMVQQMFNRMNGMQWDSVRGFLGVHYKFNDRLDTPFWKHCRQHTNLADAAEAVEYYQQMGPDGYWGVVGLNKPHDQFAIGGYITLMVGMKVPFHRTFTPNEQQMADFEKTRNVCKTVAMNAVSVREALSTIRSPGWRWQ